MEEKEGVIDLHYLPKVLLQYENSPYLDNEDLVDASQHLPLVCSLDLCSGKYMCIAFGRRMVVFPTTKHTHPECFVSAVTPSPQEVVTCVSFLGRDGRALSSTEGHENDIRILMIGTSKGFLQIHSINIQRGDHVCLHRQRVNEKAITNISVTESHNGGIISAGTRDGIVLVHCIDVLSAWQWHKKGRQPPDVDAHAWEFYTVGPRHASIHVPCKATPRSASLHSALIDMNRAGSSHKAVQEQDMLILTAGKDPPIAFYALHEKHWASQKSGIFSSLVTMSSKMLFGRKKADEDHHHGEAGMVIEHSETRDTPIEDRPLKKHTTLASPYTSVWDDTKRDCFGLDVSSSGAWAACCDSLGRILIISIRDGCIFKMLKGYRDCQVAWVNLGEDDANLFIYAPKRNVVELWDVCKTGRKMKTIRNNVTDKGLLIGTTHTVDSSVACLLDLKTCTLHSIRVLSMDT
ncbi:hypothetical protein M9434_007136 [Picochlorum sp. BPE23]|nr:hypothetical protein M9434_007136 [Picochlorum sp. BPE23]